MVRKHISVCIPLPHITNLVCFLNRLYVFGCVCSRPHYNRYMLYYNYCNMIYVYMKIKNICFCNTHRILDFSVSSRLPLLLLLAHISLLASLSFSFFIFLHLSTLTLCWAALGLVMVQREEGETGDGRRSVFELTPDFLNNQIKNICINIHISQCKIVLS